MTRVRTRRLGAGFPHAHSSMQPMSVRTLRLAVATPASPALTVRPFPTSLLWQIFASHAPDSVATAMEDATAIDQELRDMHFRWALLAHGLWPCSLPGPCCCCCGCIYV